LPSSLPYTRLRIPLIVTIYVRILCFLTTYTDVSQEDELKERTALKGKEAKRSVRRYGRSALKSDVWNTN